MDPNDKCAFLKNGTELCLAKSLLLLYSLKHTTTSSATKAAD